MRNTRKRGPGEYKGYRPSRRRLGSRLRIVLLLGLCAYGIFWLLRWLSAMA